MTVVYIDVLILLNGGVNYFLLLAAGRIGAQPLFRWRILMGALLGGLYAAATLFPPAAFLLHPLCKAAVGLLMVLVAYGNSPRLLRMVLIFFALSCALGGAFFALQLLDGAPISMHNGVLYANVNPWLLLLFTGGFHLLFSTVLQRTAAQNQRQLCPVVLELSGRRVALNALLDTGNSLTDPATGQPVLVVEARLLLPLLPDPWPLQPEQLQDPVNTMLQLAQNPMGARFRLLPYQAVGVPCGMLLAIRLDNVRVNGASHGALLAALSPTPLSDGGSYHALVGVISS